MSTPIRFGILSCGRISADFVHAISQTPHATVSHVAARSPASAHEFLTTTGLSTNAVTVCDDYSALMASPCDIVYIGTLAQHHFDLAMTCLKNNKPCLVEKPLSLSSAETSLLIETAREHDTFLFEGMWSRCFPATEYVRETLAGGSIGTVVSVQGDFGWQNHGCGPDDRIWDAASGGMVMDIGMYCIQWGLLAFGTSVKNVMAMGTMRNGVDQTGAGTVQFEEGGILQFIVTGDSNTEERMIITGTKGYIVIKGPHHVPEEVLVSIDQGRGYARNETVRKFPLPDDSFCSWNYPGSVGFVHEIEEVARCLREGEKESGMFNWEETKVTAEIIEKIKAQIRA